MTIATSANSISYTGDGVSTAFAFPYPFITTADLKVYVNGVVQTTGFSVAGTAPVTGSGTYVNGTVTFVVAPASTLAVLIYCDPDQLQSTALPANDPFPSKTVEKMIDKVTLLIQRLAAKFGNAITFPPGDTANGVLGSAAARASRVLGFDAAGALALTTQLPSGSFTTGNAYVDQFVGTGAQTAFTLSNNPGTQQNLAVSVSGLDQKNGVDFTWASGTTLTFTTAPALGDLVQVRYTNALALSAAVDTAVTIRRSETGAVNRTLNFNIQRSRLAMSNFCDPTNDTPAQIAAAFVLAQAAALAGGKVLEFDPGATYISNAEFAFLGATGIRGARFWGNGATLYRSTGSGPVASLDSAGATNRCDDIEFADFRMRGNAASTYALYMRGLCRSRVRSLRAVDVATAGYKIDWGVCVNFKDLIMSNNIDTFAIAAAKGLIVDQSQLGNYTADCIFENMLFEGVGAITDVGIEIANGGLNNVFRGGTCEGLLRGFRMLNGSAVDNTITEMDFESNTDYDVSAQGNGLTLQDVNITSAAATGNLIITSTARNTTVRGGFVRWAAIDPSSLGTRFYGTKVSDSASVGITAATSFSLPAAGTHQAYGVIKVNGSHVPTSNYPDVYAAPGTWTPGFASAGGGASGTVTFAVGTYSLIGKLCFFSGYMSIAKGTLGAGTVTVTGLPFPAHATANSFQYANASEWDSITLGAGYTAITLRIAPSGSVASVLKCGTAVVSAVLNVADFADPMVLKFSGSYEIA